MLRTRWTSIRLPLFFLAMVVSLSQASTGWHFSRSSVLADYRNGNFEQVIASLKGIMAEGAKVSAADSVFAFRLLGVVYVSDPQTREKGRYCWLHLLELDAKSNLVDLFVGEEIDRFWERTRMEFRVRYQGVVLPKNLDSTWITPDEALALQKLLDEESQPSHLVDTTVMVTSSLESGEKPGGMQSANSEARPFGNAIDIDSRPYWRRPGSWMAAAVTAGVVGFTMYYTLGDTPTPKEKFYHVPKETASTQ
jgi:hypothetical protein